jgi:cell division protein FtsW (lipid II flippase)
MPPKLLRLAFTTEFLLAVLAIFTAWSEIGGQATLDSMNWYWKSGLSFALAAAIVGYSAAITYEDKLWTLRSTRWLTGACVVVLMMAVVTYYFELQVEASDGEDSSAISLLQ